MLCPQKSPIYFARSAGGTRQNSSTLCTTTFVSELIRMNTFRCFPFPVSLFLRDDCLIPVRKLHQFGCIINLRNNLKGPIFGFCRITATRFLPPYLISFSKFSSFLDWKTILLFSCFLAPIYKKWFGLLCLFTVLWHRLLLPELSIFLPQFFEYAFAFYVWLPVIWDSGHILTSVVELWPCFASAMGAFSAVKHKMTRRPLLARRLRKFCVVLKN